MIKIFADVPVAFHVDARASLWRDFGAICELCRSANFAMSGEASGVFSLALQNPKYYCRA